MSLILIAEDNRSMGQATGEVLKSHGHEAILAYTQAEAISKYQERKPDLVLTEFYLQEGSGLELVESLLKLDRNLQIIMVTGYGREELAVEVMAKGAWHYCLKGESYFDGLPHLVEEALRKRAEERQKREREQQDRRLEAQNELSGWLAHNFKNILAAAVGSLNLITPGHPEQSPEKQKEYLGDCRGSLNTAIALLEQLAEMTKGGAGEAEKLLVADIADQAWFKSGQALLTQAAARNAQEKEKVQALLDRVSFLNSTRSLPPQFLVRRDLTGILEALMVNALEAVTETGQPRVLVRGELRGDFFEMTIKDNGRGMNAEILAHAQEPLFSTKGEVGVGLSLSLVRSLVARHGGELEMESQPGQGTVVKFSWAL